jgi:hypothetical protein
MHYWLQVGLGLCAVRKLTSLVSSGAEENGIDDLWCQRISTASGAAEETAGLSTQKEKGEEV